MRPMPDARRLRGMQRRPGLHPGRDAPGNRVVCRAAGGVVDVDEHLRRAVRQGPAAGRTGAAVPGPAWSRWPTTCEVRSKIRCRAQANETSGAAQRRRFGLFGSSRELRFDVLQLTPQQGNPIPVGRTAGRSRRDAGRPRAGTAHRALHFLRTECRRRAVGTGPAGAGADRTGLRDAAGQRRHRGQRDGGIAAVGRVGGPGQIRLHRPRRFDGDPESAADDTRLSVPEVVSLQFRYFDGRGWTDAWNSLDRKSLPAAVEIQLATRRLVVRQPPTAGRGPDISGPDGQSLAAAEATDDALSAAEAGQEPPSPPSRPCHPPA